MVGQLAQSFILSHSKERQQQAYAALPRTVWPHMEQRRSDFKAKLCIRLQYNRDNGSEDGT